MPLAMLVVGVFIGFGLQAAAAAAYEWWLTRQPKRRGPDQRDYLDPCGAGCTSPRRSERV